MTLAATEPVPAEALRRHGEAILRALAIGPVTAPPALADRIVPDGIAPFRDRLRYGLEALLRAVAGRNPEQAAHAARALVGVGPGATPLGDDYLAACGLTLALLGSKAGLRGDERDTLIGALRPDRLLDLTTPTSREMIAGALAGEPPEAVRDLYRSQAEPQLVTAATARVAAIGASTGRGWAAAIGATSLVLGTHDPATTRQGDTSRCK